MRTIRNRLLYTMVGCAFGHLLFGAKPLAAQADCALPLNAVMKVFDTPTHAYVTMNMGGKPQTLESIYVGGAVYAKYNGKWTAGSTTKEIKDIAEKDRKNNQTTCRYLNDEPVNGEMTAVYTIHEVSAKATTDSKTWISKSKGLPLRSDTDLDGGKNRISTRYEYDNVKAPL